MTSAIIRTSSGRHRKTTSIAPDTWINVKDGDWQVDAAAQAKYSSKGKMVTTEVYKQTNVVLGTCTVVY